MAKDLMEYGQMVEDSLRAVVRTVLTRTSVDGLLGNHHFYIGFNTKFPGVDIPDQLEAKYPDEMTIVIQHKFWGLEVHQDFFEITLSFNELGQRLVIPFAALTSFMDPSVQFGLQFGQPEENKKSTETADLLPEKEKLNETDGSGDNVITLDQFRND